MVSKRTEDLIKSSAKYLIGVQVPVGAEPWVVIEKGHGVWLQDTEGREGIDLISSGSVSNLGHGRKEIIDAMLEQMSKVEYCPCRRGPSNPTLIECAQKLTQITPEGLNHVNFVTGGAEANDMAFKLTYLYWRVQGKNRQKIISLYGGYHGVGAASWASSRPSFDTENWGPPAAGFLHIPSYNCYRCMFGLRYPDCDVRCARYLAQVIENERPETVAAFIGEPVIGGYGNVPPPPEYWPIVRQICNDYGVLLIADEILVGFARTGKMFALEHWGVKPDIMTMSKAIASGYVPFGAVAINEKVYQVLKGTPQTYNNTFASHPVGCAAALAAMNIYTRDKVADNAAKVGKHIFERFDSEFKSLPLVDNITHLGMALGMDIVADKKTKVSLPPAVKERLIPQFWQKGLFTMAAIGGFGGTRLMVGPPCTITIEEADIMVDRLRDLLSSIKI